MHFNFCAGIAWTLQRQKSAPWLGLHLHDKSQHHTTKQFKRLELKRKMLVKASQGLSNLRMLASPCPHTCHSSVSDGSFSC